MARTVRTRLSVLAQVAHLAPRPSRRPLPVAMRRTLVVRLASERTIPIVAALVVLGASLVSFQPAAAQPIGGTSGAGEGPRLVVGGETSGNQLDPVEVAGLVGGVGARAAQAGDAAAPSPAATYADDGTIWKAFAPSTAVQDGKGLLKTYTVRSGDTLTGIASRYGVSMMTVWWANKLTSKDDLRVGQKLVIPPVNGLIVTVKDGDTLEALAATYKVDASEIVSVNALSDPNLVIGQTLILPDARGSAIPTPTPKPVVKPRTSSGGSSSGGVTTYSGGAFRWPVVGGGNYVSQPFRYGHYGLDIAATYNTPVVAATGGTVTFAGWKNNGGGYQVWISHGSGIFTTYNHMSGVTVAAGQSVAAGQQVGRIGQSGNATGPHVHFEVWLGPIWNGGTRVNPRGYY
ncbi:MAG: peptidoglycan DD-metalloendopeptidase family protein [Chloroflexi bacterium]|nr:peptidoglycan DD-metalloendopeptidase family protein [Chloroflexota bacterium]